MNDEINFNSWGTPKLSDNDLERLFRGIQDKVAHRNRRSRQIKIFTTLSLLIAAIVSVLVTITPEKRTADLQVMLKEEIVINERLKLILGAEPNHNNNMEEYYEPTSFN